MVDLRAVGVLCNGAFTTAAAGQKARRETEFHVGREEETDLEPLAESRKSEDVRGGP